MCRYSFASADAQSCRPWHPSPYFGECLRALAQLNSDEQRGAANVTSLPSDGARAPDAAWAADSLRPRHPPPGVPFAAIRRRTSGTERLGEMRPERGPEMLVLKTKIDDRLQVLELVSCVEVAGILNLTSEKEVTVID